MEKAAPGPAHSKQVWISRLLSEELILIRPPARDKDQLLRGLVDRLCSVRGLGDPAPLLAKVLEREQGISTTLDTGLSLPHARLDAASQIVAVLGLVPGGLIDPKQPDLPIRAMFLFFSPNKQEAFSRHLQLLRGVAALFQPPFLDQLLAQSSPSEVLELIRRKEA